MTEPTRWVILDDRDGRLRWSGKWDSVSGDNFNSQGNFGQTYLNTLHGSNTDGSGLSFTFTGNAARIMGTTDLRVNADGVPDPDWECILDGQVVRRQNPFPYTENNWVFCEFTNVVAGEHTIGLRIKTTGRSFWIDQIQYRPTGIVQNQVITATRDDADLAYSSGWAPLAEVAHNTMIRGSTATFRFVGSSVSLWAMYPRELPHEPGQGTYTVDGGSPVSFTIAGGGDMSHYNRRIFEITGLSSQPHTLVMSYTSTGRTTPLVIGQLLVGGGSNLRAPASSSNLGSSSTATTGPLLGGITASSSPDIVPGEDQAFSLAGSASSATSTAFLPTDHAGSMSPVPTGGASAPLEHGSANRVNGESGVDAARSTNTPIGAIVGAIVGGLAIILLVLGFIWYRRRKRIILRSNDPSVDYSPFSLTAHPHSHFYPTPVVTNQYHAASVAIPTESVQGSDAPAMSNFFATSTGPVQAHPGARTKENLDFSRHYVSNPSFFEQPTHTIGSTTRLMNAPTQQDHTLYHHSPGGSTSQSVSAASQYTTSHVSSNSFHHQDSGIRLPPQASQVIQEFPPTYTPR